MDPAQSRGRDQGRVRPGSDVAGRSAPAARSGIRAACPATGDGGRDPEPRRRCGAAGPGVRRLRAPARAHGCRPAASRGTSASSLDGNRRWARANGANTAAGPPGRGGQDPARCSAGATRSASRSSPCGCSPPTTSTAPPPSSTPLLAIIEDAVDGPRRRRGRWRVNPVGALDLLPAPTAARLKEAADAHPRRQRHARSTSPSATAAGTRSPTRCARCCRSTPRAAPRSRSWPRSSTSSTSPSTSTPRASPTPTSSSAPPASSGSRRLPALAERAQRVLLLRGLLAGLPPGRLPAGPARLRRARAPVRRLSGARPPGRAPSPRGATRAGSCSPRTRRPA